jgi:glycosyltransferase involved in cell wall biosynthesis
VEINVSNDLCSIVVPIFNGENFLPETIESYIHQDYINKELILVDDGSNDESYKIARDYELQYPGFIRAFRNQENLGLVKTFCFGIEASKGAYISGLGHDDIIFPDRLSRLIKCIEYYKVSMICSNAYFFIGNEKTNHLVRGGAEWSKSRYLNKYDFLFQNPVIGSSAIFRKNAFERIDRSFFRYKNFMEWIHWFQYTLLDGVYFISDPYLYYRKHSSNISNYLFDTEDYREYKRFCQKYVLSKLNPIEILIALINFSLGKIQSKLNK